MPSNKTNATKKRPEGRLLMRCAELLGTRNLEEFALFVVTFFKVERTPLLLLEPRASIVKTGVVGVHKLEIARLATLETA